MKRSPAASPIHAVSTRGRILRAPAGLTCLAMALLASTGCYHATGVKRGTLVAEVVPVTNGDKVGGFKATAAPGDYYLGNDFIHMAVDGSLFGTRTGQKSALLGGSILDIGDVLMDQNYVSISTPADRLERLSLVVNQDPDLRVVVDSIKPANTENSSTLVMSGRVFDPKHKITGASWDGSDCVVGLAVTHTLSLNKLDHFFVASTTVSNNGTTALGVFNVGDHLHQVGGGYRLNIPASQDLAGNLVGNWGVDIPSTGVGTSFGHPESSLQASMVGLMGCEPSANMDYHASVGILPTSGDRLVVTSSPQQVFEDSRPIVASDLVAGSRPAIKALSKGATPSTSDLLALNAGASIDYTRRIYVIAGASESQGLSYYSQTLGAPNQATGLFNTMAMDSYLLNASDFGTLVFTLAGTAVKNGPIQNEIRIERYVGSIDPIANPNAYLADSDPNHWQLERTEWLEPEDNPGLSSVSFSELGVLLPSSSFYRVAFRNRLSPLPSAAPWIYVNTNNEDAQATQVPLRVDKDEVFYLSAQAHLMSGAEFEATVQNGQIVHYLFDGLSVSARTADAPAGTAPWQPYRINVVGHEVGGQITPDPNFPRQRTLGGAFNVVTRDKGLSGVGLGSYRFMGGNQIFGTELSASLWLPSGNYRILGSHGPLASISDRTVTVHAGLGGTSQAFVANREFLPSGWASFDLPAPSQATTGGFLPAEKLSSALTECVQVVGNTELDLLTDPDQLYNEFRIDFDNSGSYDAQRYVIRLEPYVVGARSSYLNGYGTATALFTPTPRNERMGGARDSSNWTLADFITQAEGQYNVLHRPRGPEGLFTLKNFDPASPIPAWWSAQGPFSLGKKDGDFDALELINASSWSASDPDAWFNEFQAVRADWFSLLNQQTPTAFTKALGLSSAVYSVDTPVGMARTYLKAQILDAEHEDGFKQDNLTPVLTALKKGALVASTGPLLDVSVSTNGQTGGPGDLLTGSNSTATLTLKLYAAQDWVPVDDLRVVINGVTTTLDINQLEPLNPEDPNYDWRLRQGTFTLNLPTGTDAWVVVEAGVPLTTTGTYMPGSAWEKIMHGIYPVAVSNPIFVARQASYVAPGL